jgi:hypothetical protein
MRGAAVFSDPHRADPEVADWFALTVRQTGSSFLVPASSPPSRSAWMRQAIRRASMSREKEAGGVPWNLVGQNALSSSMVSGAIRWSSASSGSASNQ